MTSRFPAAGRDGALMQGHPFFVRRGDDVITIDRADMLVHSPAGEWHVLSFSHQEFWPLADVWIDKSAAVEALLTDLRREQSAAVSRLGTIQDAIHRCEGDDTDEILCCESPAMRAVHDENLV